jgi:hypothetical protein
VTGVLSVIGKPMLVPWAAKVTTEKLAELFKPGVSYNEIEIKQMLDTAKRAHYDQKTTAGDIGTLVHKTLEQIIKGENPSLPVHDEARNAVQRFIDWRDENKVEFLMSEQPVYSKKYKYAGTLDFICKINGKLMVGDIKTSNQIYKVEMGAQMAAYKMAREEEFKNEHYQGCILVRVGKKDAEFETWTIDDVSIYEKIFLTAMWLFKEIKYVEN